jgi:hypothetical protein
VNDTDVTARLREVTLTVVQQRSPMSLTSGTGTLTDRSIAALLPVVREIADQRAAEELESAAAYWDRPTVRTIASDLRDRARALRGEAGR